MSQTERFYISTGRPEDEVEAIRLGLRWLADRVRRDNAAEAILGIPTLKYQLQPDNVIGRALGTPVVKALAAKRPLSLEGAQFRAMAEGQARFLNFQSPTPVLCVYTGMRMLNALDDGSNVSAICLATPHRGNQEWIDRWNPIDLRGRGPSGPPADAAFHPVLKEALETLTSLVNLSTGLAHPSDRDLCIDVFRRLWRSKIPYSPDGVKSYLISQKRWRPAGAEEARVIAEGVLKGRRFRTARGIRLRPDIVQQWKRKAEQRKKGSDA